MSSSEVIYEPDKSSRQSQRCLRCGGGKLEPSKLSSTGGVSFRPTNAKFWSLIPTAEVRALICLDCGHVELLGDLERVEKIVKSKSQ